MRQSKPLGNKIPFTTWLVVLLKWAFILICYVPMWLLNFPMSLIVAAVVKPMTNVFGESERDHSQKYIDKGSSGRWVYYGTNLPIIKLWSNLEDGIGEPSGRWSSLVKGKELKYWNKVKWFIRNPFNYGKRMLPIFACMVNDCDVSYYGNYEVSDRGTFSTGRYLAKAKHKKTGRTYYGYRAIFLWEDFFKKLKMKTPKFFKDTLQNLSLGFKVKPSHGDVIQVEDDRDKAFTFRIQFTREIARI